MTKPPSYADNRLKLLKRLRKDVHVHTRHTIENMGEGKERLTCKVCGFSEVQIMGGTDEKHITKAMAERLVKYRAQTGGVTGECKQCTQRRRDERYPLPK